jgi:hypothetical protein
MKKDIKMKDWLLLMGLGLVVIAFLPLLFALALYAIVKEIIDG